MIKLPEPDTHCVDTDTGKDVWSHSTEQLKQFGRDLLEEAAKVCIDAIKKHDCHSNNICANEIRALIKEIEACGK